MSSEVIGIYFRKPRNLYALRRDFPEDTKPIINRDMGEISYFTSNLDPIAKEDYRKFSEQTLPYTDITPKDNLPKEQMTLYVRRTKAVLCTFINSQPVPVPEDLLEDETLRREFVKENQCIFQDITPDTTGVSLLPESHDPFTSIANFEATALWYFIPDRNKDADNFESPTPPSGKKLEPALP